jgi:hypothetical protein
MSRADQGLLAAIVCGILVIFGFIGILAIVGNAIEIRGEYAEQHDRCLKNAANGLEIERCR